VRESGWVEGTVEDVEGFWGREWRGAKRFEDLEIGLGGGEGMQG